MLDFMTGKPFTKMFEELTGLPTPQGGTTFVKVVVKPTIPPEFLQNKNPFESILNEKKDAPATTTPVQDGNVFSDIIKEHQNNPPVAPTQFSLLDKPLEKKPSRVRESKRSRWFDFHK